MKKIIAYHWYSGRTTIGIVVYQNNFNVIKAVMTTVPGVNEKLEIQTIADYGSKISKEMAIGAFDDGMGTIEDILLWNEYKATVPGPRVSLDADNFKTLVSGGEVKYGTTKIILQDIGWDLMLKLINNEIDKDE